MSCDGDYITVHRDDLEKINTRLGVICRLVRERLADEDSDVLRIAYDALLNAMCDLANIDSPAHHR